MPNESIIVVNDAFSFKNYILTPFSRRCQLTYREKIFNYNLCRVHCTVENAFGILALKFQIFQKSIQVSLEKSLKLC